MATTPSVGYLPQIVSVTSQCGCTLTNASITGLTPDNFQALAGTETNLARVIANSAEAKILGVKEGNLATLLRSSIKDVKKSLNTVRFDEQSMILPYIQRRQRRRLNSNFWSISGSGVCSDAGKVVDGISYPASTIDLNLDLGESPWNSSDVMKDLGRYFLPGMTLIVQTWGNNTTATKAGVNTAATIQYQIVASNSVAAAGTTKAYATVSVFPIGSSAPTFRPEFGVAVLAANNISDYEAWCQNQPADNNLGLLVNWFQTTRETRCTSQVYRETLQKIMDGKVNPWDQTFNFLSIAEQNKRAAQLSEKAWLNSVFFNDYLSSAQTPESYTSLPTVSDPEDPTCTLEYKANSIGIYTMLNQSGRVVDYAGGQIHFNQLFEQLYELKRHREADGDSINVIDCLTDRQTANYLYEFFVKYFKKRYGWSTDRFAKLNQKLTYNNLVNFEYDLYDIPEASLQLAVFRDQYFDDQIFAYKYAANKGPNQTNGTNTNLTDAQSGTNLDFTNRARSIWFLDWSDISVGIGGSNSVTRKSPDAATDRLYKCRMASNTTEYNLRSTKWTTFLDRPDRHLLLQNFSVDMGDLTLGTGDTQLGVTGSSLGYFGDDAAGAGVAS